VNRLDKALIGCCLIDQGICDEILSEALTEWFDGVWGGIFEEIKIIKSKHGSVDLVLLKDNPNIIQRAMEAVSFVPSVTNYRTYLDQIKIRFVKKSLVLTAKKFFDDGDMEKYKSEIDKIINDLSATDSKCKNLTDDLIKYAEIIESRRHGKNDKLQTGYYTVDKLTGGLGDGDMLVIGARTSRGKSAACINIANHFLTNEYPILYVSSEMTYVQIMDRITSLRSFISLGKLRWQLSDDEFAKVTETLKTIHGRSMIVFEGGFLNIQKIKNLIERHKPKAVFVDYIQGFIPPPKTFNRAAYYSEIAYTLKGIAMQYKISVIAASQFSRQIEYIEREPTLADFKESGGIEEAADICILLHPKKKESEIDGIRKYDWIIAKDRNGPCGRIPFIFHERFTRFSEMEIEERNHVE
jgi:replicative DNA helicase